MRPLASPVVEYRLMGVVQLVGGAAFGAVAITVSRPVAAAVELVIGGAIFGGLMYPLAYRRFVRSAVRDVGEAPTAAREPGSRTRRRTVVPGACLLLMLTPVAIGTTPSIVGGALAGNGVALMLASSWLRRWEIDHGAELLREPRWRWSREGRRGWGRGRGTMDPQDFYVAIDRRNESPADGVL